MNNSTAKHTVDIFEIMYKRLPPLVPEEVKKEFDHALDHLHNDVTITSEDVEDIVIALGKKIWPYWKAFGEFLDMYQGKLGEKFLLGHLQPSLKNKYKEMKEHGATYHDLRSGGSLDYFESEEKVILNESMVDVDTDIRLHASQAVLSLDRKKYEDLIIDFQTILDDIEKRLETFRILAEDEEEHPRLADEIRAQVRSFEFGLCLLGPNTQHIQVLEAEDYFIERRKGKKIHRFD
mgnify:CR=1 FL=1